jgi:hypothetical protein
MEAAEVRADPLDALGLVSDKPPLPDNLRALALAAKSRVQKLGTSAPLADITPSATGNYMESPYATDDWELWACLLLDTFGTRDVVVAHAFMRQLAKMIPKHWDNDLKAEVIDTELFQLALSIICSLRPRNEAEAAIAVHCVALHLATHKVADQIGSRSWLDPKTGTALAAITKAYAAQVLVLQQMRTPARAKRQVIKVQKSVTVNYTDARQVHLRDRGGHNSGNQPDATEPQRAGASRAGSVVAVAALPSSDEGGEVLSFASREGEASVPNARRSAGERGAQG